MIKIVLRVCGRIKHLLKQLNWLINNTIIKCPKPQPQMSYPDSIQQFFSQQMPRPWKQMQPLVSSYSIQFFPIPFHPKPNIVPKLSINDGKPKSTKY